MRVNAELKVHLRAQYIFLYIFAFNAVVKLEAEALKKHNECQTHCI